MYPLGGAQDYDAYATVTGATGGLDSEWLKVGVERRLLLVRARPGIRSSGFPAGRTSLKPAAVAAGG